MGSVTRPDLLPPGIVRTATGYRVFQWVPDPTRPKGRMKSKRWKHDATVKEMQQWQEKCRVDAREPRPIVDQPIALQGFIADAATYLQTVRAMPSHKDRVRDIGQWIAIFGETPSLAIGSPQIRAARDRWLTIGPKRVLEKTKGEKVRWVSKAVPVSASAVNHRLRALENFFTVMYPKVSNPVREVPEADPPDQEPRGYSFALAQEVLAHMPDRTTPKKGGTHEPGSLSRVRFETMLWTGLPAVQLARLKPELVDWVAGTVLVPRRQKGKKSRRARRRQERPRPLLPQAIAALKRFFSLEANRQFSSTSLGRSVKRAIRAANVVRAAKRLPLISESITVYDLTRHTFGTEIFRASKNLKAVQDLLGHSDINQSARYAMAAVTEHTVQAIQQAAAQVRLQAIAKKTRKTFAGRAKGRVSPLKTAYRVRTTRTRTR